MSRAVTVKLSPLSGLYGFAVIAALAVGVVWYYRKSITQAVEQIGSIPQQAIQATSPAYWGLKDDGNTLGTRGWFANMVEKLETATGLNEQAGPDLYEQGIYEKPSTYPQLPAFDDDGVNVPYGVTPYQSEETMFFTGGSQYFNERTGEYIGGE